jgi:flagellin-like hook-associated protein FlgL
MSITGIGSRSALAAQSLLDMRRQLDDLQRQLGSGKKADTYAGIGLDRGLVVGLRSQLSTLEAFDDSITQVSVRLDLAQTTLGRIGEIGKGVKSAAFQASAVDSNGSTLVKSMAQIGLEEVLGLLNTQSGDRYLFSGRAADQPAVETFDHIMNGDGARAGFNQIVTERKAADLGIDGLGRLAITAPTATSVQVAEDAVSPFGFKLAAISATLTGATLTGPAGSPPAMSVDLAANPNAGETIQFRFNLPDGTSETITLVATASTTPAAGEFTIGATPDATAANLQAALTSAVDKLADTSLTAASALVAAENFFGSPPQRVAGPPPLGSATSLVAGTSADTVIWYTGENGPDPARASATARIDAASTVSYGLRANEEGIRFILQNLAAAAAMTLPPADPNASARSTAINQRLGTNLGGPPDVQKVEDIQTDIANAQATLISATDRHRQTKATLSDMLQEIEGVKNEDVATQILALQTRLQASLQTTAMLSQISLVNYL